MYYVAKVGGTRGASLVVMVVVVVVVVVLV